MNGLFEHVESFLGQMEYGWKDSDGTVWPFHVLRFSGGPIANTITITTMGLSDTPMPSPVSNKQIRHELLFMARPSFCDGNIPAILHQVGMEAISDNRPYLRGELIGPRRGTLIAGTRIEALYVTNPFYLPDSFAPYRSPEGIACVFAWLIPITAKEAEFASKLGWKRFEDELIATDPDLLDLKRPSMVE
jgi:hypothetical protein